MKKPFFEATRESLTAITSLYDFLWPTTTALWNLRWQVAGYCLAHPAASVSELRARFVEGSGIHGANLRRACIETSWSDQASVLGGVLLTNLFAVYEGWTKRIVRALGQPKSAARKLQSRGILDAVAAIRSPTSPLLEQSVYPVLRARPICDPDSLEHLVVIYRYFKEIRNAQLHNHGVANGACLVAYTRLVEMMSEAEERKSLVPEHLPIVEDQVVSVTLRGAVGFSDTIRRMLYSIDAELARSIAAEPALDRLWWSHRRRPGLFKSDRDLRWRQITRTFQRMGFAGVDATEEVERALVARGLVRFER